MAANELRAFECRVAYQTALAELRRRAAKLPKATKAGLLHWSRFAVDRFKLTRLSGAGGLKRRTGALAKSFYYTVRGETFETIESVLGSRRAIAPYAMPLEKGAVIKSKRPGGFLAIPVRGGPALTPAGVDRYGGGPLGLRNTLPQSHAFWAWRNPTTGKLWLLGRPRSGAGAVRAWYRLVKEVTLPPKLKFEKTIRLYLRVLAERLKADVKRAADE